jgi:dTDP-4-amino-4,6-dideoxygalactose transaminase
VKLRHLDVWNGRRRRIAERYQLELKGSSVTLPSVHPDCQPVWHLYVVRHPNRDALQQRLAAHGIHTLIHYPTPPHLQGAYEDLRMTYRPVERAEQLAKTCLSLPIGPQMADGDLSRVIEHVSATPSVSH